MYRIGGVNERNVAPNTCSPGAAFLPCLRASNGIILMIGFAMFDMRALSQGLSGQRKENESAALHRYDDTPKPNVCGRRLHLTLRTLTSAASMAVMHDLNPLAADATIA